MKCLLIASFVAILITVSGCSQSVPKCGDQETKDLVMQIADDEVGKQLGANVAKMFTYSINAVRTTGTNEQTGAHECACQLSVREKSTGNVNELSITYTVEKTGKDDEFYVNVFGL